MVDFDNAQQFSEMGEAVLKLSTQLPMAAEGIGQIVAAGGQAGIARKDLIGFASDAVKMGSSFRSDGRRVWPDDGYLAYSFLK